MKIGKLRIYSRPGSWRRPGEWVFERLPCDEGCFSLFFAWLYIEYLRGDHVVTEDA